MVDMNYAEKFFCRAMAQVWVSGGLIEKHPLLPGHDLFTFEEGNFCLRDFWCGNDDKSAGTTVIEFKSTPIWVMHYGGRYPKFAIPFLKRVLARQYQEGIFEGGRGPDGIIDLPASEMVYRNKIYDGRFTHFSGMEEITSADNETKLIGFHEYFGLWLLD